MCWNWEARGPISRVKLVISPRHVGRDGTETGRGVPFPQRGLVALGRDHADAGEAAGAALRYKGGVFGGSAGLALFGLKVA
jgi:hypothetical protein